MQSKRSLMYAQDYNLWAIKTAELLKERRFDEVDWESLIEEIVDLSRRERQKLASLLTRLLEHLLKLMLWESQRADNQNHWRAEIINFRIQIKRLLRDSPSLKPHLQEIYNECFADAKKVVSQLIATDIPDEIRICSEQVLEDDWFPIS